MDLLHLLEQAQWELLEDLLWATAPILIAGAILALGAVNPLLAAAAELAVELASAPSPQDFYEEQGARLIRDKAAERIIDRLTSGSTPAVRGFGRAAGRVAGALGRMGKALGIVAPLVEFTRRMSSVMEKYARRAAERAGRHGPRRASGGHGGSAGPPVYPRRWHARVPQAQPIDSFPLSWFPANLDRCAPHWRGATAEQLETILQTLGIVPQLLLPGLPVPDPVPAPGPVGPLETPGS